MSPKELQVSSGQRDKGGRKRPRTTDSKVVKPVRASGAGTPEDGIEAARLPTTQPSLFMSRSGEGTCLSLQLLPQRKHQRYQELRPSGL